MTVIRSGVDHGAGTGGAWETNWGRDTDDDHSRVHAFLTIADITAGGARILDPNGCTNITCGGYII